MHNFIAENWILQLQCPILYEEVSTTFCDFFLHLGVSSSFINNCYLLSLPEGILIVIQPFDFWDSLVGERFN